MSLVSPLVRAGLPFLAWNLTLIFYGQIDRVLLGVFVPTQEVGWYAAAYRIIGITVFVPTLVVSPLFPALSRGVRRAELVRPTIAQSLRVLLLLTAPLSALFIVAAPFLPSLLRWPSDFVNAVPLMMILALHIPVVAIDLVLAAVIMAIGAERRWVIVGIAASIFNVATNFVAIPVFQQLTGNGAMGAASVTVATELLMFAGAAVLIPKRFIDPSVGFAAARILVATGIAVAAGIAASSFGLIACVSITALTYATILVAVREPNDVWQLLSHLQLRLGPADATS
jgi:O-antigen/teichoic acid export membrane protein